MKFNPSTDFVIGAIWREVGTDCARIKVLAIDNGSGQKIILTNEERLDVAPPNGTVFAPSLLRRTEHKVGDVLKCQIKEIDNPKVGDDEFMFVSPDKAKMVGYKCIPILGKVTNRLDLSTISLVNKRGDFYGVTDKYVISKLRINSNGELSAVSGTKLDKYDRDEQDFVSWLDTDHRIQYHLLVEPTGASLPVDCMTDAELMNWFFKKLRGGNTPLLGSIKKDEWKKEFRHLLDHVSPQGLDELRLHRIEDRLGAASVSFDQFSHFINSSTEMKRWAESQISRYKKELLADYETETELEKARIRTTLDDVQAELKQQKKTLEEDADRLVKETQDLTKQCGKIGAEIQQEKLSLLRLQECKSRIVADYEVVREVLGLCAPSASPELQTHSFTTESFFSETDLELLKELDGDSMDDQLRSSFKSFGLQSKFSKTGNTLLAQLNRHRALFIEDIRIARSFAKMTQNTQVVYVQTEPAWLTFKSFWEAGLNHAWNEALAHPERIHIAVWADVNLASPECYARPLLDLISGARPFIPYANNGFPPNLIIMATKQPANDPSIGLPLYEKTFQNWGAVGFGDEPICFCPHSINDVFNSKGYLAVEGLQLTDFEADEPLRVVALFDEPE